MLVMNLENNNINVEILFFFNTLSGFRATTETEVYTILCMNTKKTCFYPYPLVYYSHAFNHLLQCILISLI